MSSIMRVVRVLQLSTGKAEFLILSFCVFLCLLTFPVSAGENTSQLQLKDQPERSECQVTVGGGGGYFAPLGKVGNGLDATWSGRVFGFFRWSERANLWCDMTYSRSASVEGDGNMTYLSFVPSYVLSFSPVENIRLILRPGAGLSRVAFDGRSADSSLDFTLSANGGILGDLPGGLLIGVDGGTACFFERRSSFAAYISLFAGYTL